MRSISAVCRRPLPQGRAALPLPSRTDPNRYPDIVAVGRPRTRRIVDEEGRLRCYSGGVERKWFSHLLR
jgi:hypothetical protein